MKSFLGRLAGATLAIAFPLVAGGQTNPQGWFCVASLPTHYCHTGSISPGPFAGAISGCHAMATANGEEPFNGSACNVVKSHQEFWSIKLDWHEVVMQYSCGLGHQRIKDGCLTCPAGQERQEEGTCGTPPLCVPPRTAGPSGCTLPSSTIDPTKELGGTCNVEGNPCNVGTGNKYQHEIDYVGPGPYPLRAERFYNSGPVESRTFSSKWRGYYDRSVRLVAEGGVSNATVKRADGKQYHFVLTGSAWVGDADVVGTLERLVDATGMAGWRYVNEGDEVETYDVAGRLIRIANRAGLAHTLTYSCKTASATCPVVTPDVVAPVDGLLIAVTDPAGRQLNFKWQGTYVHEMTDPAGRAYIYSYNQLAPIARLSGVVYPDGTSVRYLYGEPAHVSQTPAPGVSYRNALTGKIDENGDRFATWSYDAQGRVISSEHGIGADKVTLTYQADGTTLVTDALGGSRTYRFETILGVASNIDLARHDAAARTRTYDANRNVTSLIDFAGNRTDYVYDQARNLETSRTEGLTAAGGTTPQTRTVSTQWHATHRLPTARAEPLRTTRNSYDAGGNLLFRTIQPTSDASGAQGFSAAASGSPRTWTYTYNANGSALTIDGPRTDVQDVTTYTYYENDDPSPGKRGNVASITNAAGHLSRITAYNADGQPLTIVDPNGLVTTMTYDARQRLTSRTVGSETTAYKYDKAGQLMKVILPDGSFLLYAYDSAHRLTAIQDNLGNRIVYTLDPAGNRTREEVRDPLDQLAQTRSRVFDNLNRLFRELGAASQTTEYTYDNHGNVASVKDPLNRVTSNQYDALNRLRQVTDPALGVTQYGYNGLDALVQVRDPRNLVTTYTVDGLGNLSLQASPDTGNTANTYDAAGNLLTQTDAKGQVTRYAYDALNRVTLITFHDGSKQAYTYDQGPNGIGRLSSIMETDRANEVTSAIGYSYDQHGRVTSETRSVAGVQYVLAYAYDGSGRLSGLTYPSGRTVTYGFDALGRVSQVVSTKNNASQTVVQSVAYHPFGGVRSYTLGNGQVYARGIDLDGRIASYTLGTQSFAIGYDAASRITFISDIGSPANSNTYGYDDLDRITSAATPGTPYAYSYDPVGNRLSRSAGATTDTYAYGGTSNRVASITSAGGASRGFVFDANGSTTADGVNSYAYDVRGRMAQATSAIGTTRYQVNALGQRIRKSNSLGDTLFHYDTRGRLIAETNPSGTIKREVIYLGDIPVAIAQ